MTIKPEVLAAIESLENNAFSWIELDDECDKAHVDLQLIQSELLAMDAEVVRLRKIEEERWSVVATRNAAVMRAEKSESRLAAADTLLRESHPFVPITYSSTGQPQLHARIQSHLSELDAMHNIAREVGE